MKNRACILAFILFLFPIVWAGTLSAAVEVSGTITGDTTWTNMDTIIVTGYVTVAATGRLTIQAGSDILFNPGAGLYIEGQLIANGEEDNRILFTSSADTVGGSPTA